MSKPTQNSFAAHFVFVLYIIENFQMKSKSGAKLHKQTWTITSVEIFYGTCVQVMLHPALT